MKTENTVTHTAQLPKILESTATIRFQDCDPFNHLNNARYLDYFINAREDHILKNYNLDIYNMAMTTGAGWVVGKSQIAYFRPAKLMETVVIQSQLIGFGKRDITVELRMLETEQTHVKAFLWINFVHFRLSTGKSEIHAENLMHLFDQVHAPINEVDFDKRFMHFINAPKVQEN
jgi:YbgC/YbaW family acyl-CoA thioester hydrolase